jgi:hypothetical protein
VGGRTACITWIFNIPFYFRVHIVWIAFLSRDSYDVQHYRIDCTFATVTSKFTSFFSFTELLQLLFSIAHSYLLFKMGARSWQENCGKFNQIVCLMYFSFSAFCVTVYSNSSPGGYCFVAVHIIWPCKSIHLSGM